MMETKYKQTEVGLIPEEWERKPLKEVSKMQRGTSITRNSVALGDIPVIAGGQAPAYYCNVYNREGETVTISGSGEYAGYVAYWEKPIFVSDAFSIKGTEYCTTKYLYYTLKGMQSKIYATKKGAGVPHVIISSIDDFLILIPPLAEQHAIASALTSIDNLIASLDKQITKTQRVKQGAMQQLLTGKTRLKEFSEPWKEKRVCDTCETIPVKLKLKTSDYLPIGKYPIIDQGQDYICGYTNIDGTMPAGEYILFGDHTCCVKYVDFPFVQGADGLKVLKTTDNSKFIYYLLCNIRIDVSYNRHWSALKEMDILVPTSLAEQHAIASTLTAIDDKISALEAKRKKYEMVKVGMMQQLLTGKIRLK